MKSFQQALQQRVNDNKKISLDRHTIKKATYDVVMSLFGSMGKGNIAVVNWEEGILTLQCEKSIWKTEALLHKNKIIEGVNSKCGNSIISEIRVRGI